MVKQNLSKCMPVIVQKTKRRTDGKRRDRRMYYELRTDQRQIQLNVWRPSYIYNQSSTCSGIRLLRGGLYRSEEGYMGIHILIHMYILLLLMNWLKTNLKKRNEKWTSKTHHDLKLRVRQQSWHISLHLTLYIGSQSIP